MAWIISAARSHLLRDPKPGILKAKIRANSDYCEEYGEDTEKAVMRRFAFRYNGMSFYR
jgi:hypothetical protein